MTRPSDIQVNAGAGLGTTEARLRLSKIGPNEPVSSRRTSGLVQILFLFINPAGRPRSGRRESSPAIYRWGFGRMDESVREADG